MLGFMKAGFFANNWFIRRMGGGSAMKSIFLGPGSGGVSIAWYVTLCCIYVSLIPFFYLSIQSSIHLAIFCIF